MFKEVRRVRRELRKVMEGKKTLTGLGAMLGAAFLNRYGVSEADLATLFGQVMDAATQLAIVGGALLALYGKVDAVRRARKAAQAQAK